MVGHTHLDFLPEANIEYNNDTESIDISSIKDFRVERDLFDVQGSFYRKVALSYLDEHIDDLKDWLRFTNPLLGIDLLYLVNDRDIINPIMKAYANDLNRRYLTKLKFDGIPATVINLPNAR